VADEQPECEVVATDTSPGALEVARANAARLGLAERVTFVEGTVPEGEFDLILANLPYIPDGDWPTLQPEVRDWEPREALTAGPDGLDAYRSLIPGVRAPALAVEVGIGQADAVQDLMCSSGFAVEVRRDLAGIERVVVGER